MGKDLSGFTEDYRIRPIGEGIKSLRVLARDNITILSTQDPFSPQSSVMYLNELTNIADVDALSFELDSATMQPVLDRAFLDKKKINFPNCPGFAFPINYGIERGIHLWASDPYQRDYLRNIAEINRRLEERGEDEEADLQRLYCDWQMQKRAEDEKRAGMTVKQIRDIAAKFKKVVHMGSDVAVDGLLRVF